MTDETTNVIMQELLRDRRKERRWRIARFLIIVALVIAYLVFWAMKTKPDEFGMQDPTKPYISLVRFNGIIMAGKSFSAQRAFPVLNEAFKDKKSKGVLIEINSPGGSPVQAGMIHDYIILMKKKYHKKAVILGDDALASGAYLVASAGDKIYVHPDTLTGSIGVIMEGFGFTDAMQKLGITRRVYTAGTHKDRLDPFSPLNPQDVRKVNGLLQQVHGHFIADVTASRHHLRGNAKELFSGDFWTGSRAVQLGLADGTMNRWQVMHKVFKVNQFKEYRMQPSLMQIITGGVADMLHLHLTLQSAALQEKI